MLRGSVYLFILMVCLFSIGVIADGNTNVPLVSVPSFSITSAGEESNELNAGAITAEQNSDPAVRATNKISAGDSLFIGESHLDVSSALGTAGSIAWWQSGNEGNVTPDVVLPISSPQVFFVDPVFFVSKTGEWYQWIGNQKGALAFTIHDPLLSLKILDISKDEDVTGKDIKRDDFGTFVIETNLYPALNRTGYLPSDSRFKITMTDPAGDSEDFLVGSFGKVHPLNQLQVDKPLWYWIGLLDDHSVPDINDGWNTSATYLNETLIYKPGVYTFRAECNLNDMKDNYKAPDGSDYTNKTVSIAQTVTLVDDAVSIDAIPKQVVPGESFVTTITGVPNAEYYLWMKGTSFMSGQSGDQPPVITPGQENVTHDATPGPFIIGNYVFSDGAGKTIRDDVPHDSVYNGTQFYGMIKLDSTGQKSVLWNTSAATKSTSYTPSIERKTDAGYVADTCTVTVDSTMPVTIMAAGTQPFHRGDSVSLSGKNSVSDITYLFMTGTGLPASGGSLGSPLTPVLSDVPSGFDSAMVSDNDTWAYNWVVPQSVPCDGTFTLYAVSMPKNLTDIGEASSGSVPVVISSHGNTTSINLVSGWNFISAPCVLADGNNTMAIFSGVNSSGHSVLSYNGSSSSWVTMKADDLFYPLHGFWIYSVSPVEIPLISGNGTITPRTLEKGWNCIGILSPDRTAGSVLGPLGSLWSYLVGYDASVQQYTAPLVEGSPSVNSTMLHVKEGSWIYIKENTPFSG